MTVFRVDVLMPELVASLTTPALMPPEGVAEADAEADTFEAALVDEATTAEDDAVLMTAALAAFMMSAPFSAIP